MTIPFATSSPRVMPPKILTKMERTLASELITSRALAMTSALAPPPMSRKLAGRPPTWLTTSHVLMARPAPLAIIPTKPSRPTYCKPELMGVALTVVEVGGAGELRPFGVAEGRIVVQGHLGIEGVHPPVGSEDQGVDLDQVGVALDEATVEAEQDRHRAPSFASSSMPASSTSWRACPSLKPS